MSATPTAETDVKVVQEAYEDVLKASVAVFFNAVLDNHQEAEQRFLAGLQSLRDARKRVLALVQG
jgi:hypothetical protein